MLIDAFRKWILDIMTPYQDRKMRILCVVKGEIVRKQQSHYDPYKGEWIYTDNIITVYYTLMYNNIGEYDCEINSSDPINNKLLHVAPEYLQIVKPWCSGDIDNEKLEDIYHDYPDRVSFPNAGVVNLPSLRANDNLLIPAGTSSEMKVITSSSGAA